jgi:tripeptide aminopeptidase
MVHGVSTHPGFAKGKMENALKIAADILKNLPKETCSPESTEGKEGFVHPVGFSGTLEQATINFILRDFSEEGLKHKAGVLRKAADDALKNYPRSSYNMVVKEQYRNMKEVLDKHPQAVEFAMKAIERAGIKPHRSSIRGGTDGSRLSYMGLPCPNIFAGEHAFHSKLEWVSVQDMQKAVDVIVNLVQIAEENY